MTQTLVEFGKDGELVKHFALVTMFVIVSDALPQTPG